MKAKEDIKVYIQLYIRTNLQLNKGKVTRSGIYLYPMDVFRDKSLIGKDRQLKIGSSVHNVLAKLQPDSSTNTEGVIPKGTNITPMSSKNWGSCFAEKVKIVRPIGCLRKQDYELLK